MLILPFQNSQIWSNLESYFSENVNPETKQPTGMFMGDVCDFGPSNLRFRGHGWPWLVGKSRTCNSLDRTNPDEYWPAIPRCTYLCMRVWKLHQKNTRTGKVSNPIPLFMVAKSPMIQSLWCSIVIFWLWVIPSYTPIYFVVPVPTQAERPSHLLPLIHEHRKGWGEEVSFLKQKRRRRDVKLVYVFRKKWYIKMGILLNQI